MRQEKVKKKNIKHFSKKALAYLMSAVFLTSGISFADAKKTDAQIPTGDDVRASSVFFDASNANATFHAWRFSDRLGNDQYNRAVANGLTLTSSIDAKIVEDGVVRVDYDATTADNRDGSNTIWGFGGGYGGSNSVFSINLRVTDPDVAQNINFRFNHQTADTLVMNLAKWMESSGFSTEIPADGEYHRYDLIVPESQRYDTSLEGMKMEFSGADKSGTVWFKPFNWSAVGERDDFKIQNRQAVLEDEDGAYPFVRYNGDASGANRKLDWTLSTGIANIVNNFYSGNTKALEIRYQNTPDHTAWASLKSNTAVSGEPVIAVTLKGNDTSSQIAEGVTTTPDDAMTVYLKNNGSVVKAIPFHMFTRALGEQHTDMSASDYVTYYYDGISDLTFDEVSFSFGGLEGESASKTYSGRVYVQDVFFPEYKTTINYYYDGKMDESETVTSYKKYNTDLSVDAVQSITHDGKLYTLDKTDSATKVVADTTKNVINVYYVQPEFNYEISYYYNNVPDDTKTVVGSAIAGTEVTVERKAKEGYRFNSITPSVTNDKFSILPNDALNKYRVDYVLDQFAYTIEYYYDGEIDDELTIKEKADFGSDISAVEHAKTGYQFTKSNQDGNAKSMTITAEESKNVLKIYYEKNTYSYTVHYFYEDDNGDFVEDTKASITANAKYRDVISTYISKIKDGYDVDNDKTTKSLTIGVDNSENVFNVYYKRNSYPYTINYYYNNVKDDTATITDTAKFGKNIGYIPREKEGYVFSKTTPEAGNITIGTGTNQIDVYYVKGQYPYRIEYYYDEILDPDKTDADSATLDEIINAQDKVIDGYVLDTEKTKADFVKVSANGDNNVLKIYYKKGIFGYKIEYYYDNKIDNSATITGNAVFGDTVKYTDKVRPGYALTKTEPGEITIKSDASKNVIKVYYDKDVYPYTVNYYYDGVLDEDATEKGSATYEQIVGYTEKAIDGYKLEKTIPSSTIKISDKAADNVINVYYVKDTFSYTIEYYYDDIKEEDVTESGKATFGDVVGYPEKIRAGYAKTKVEIADKQVDKNSGKLTITSNASKNVIKVYYDKDKYEYTVIYNFEGHDEYRQMANGAATFKDIVMYDEVRDKVTVYDGYELDTEKTGTGTIEISEINSNNVINVYYKKKVYDYTIEYYYEDMSTNREDAIKYVQDTDATVIKRSVFEETISFDTIKDNKSKTGYKFMVVTGSPLTIGTDSSKNVMKAYYVRDNFPYLVNYIFTGHNEYNQSKNHTGIYGQIVKYNEKEDGIIVPDGYSLDVIKTGEGLVTITEDERNNVIDVYYRKNAYPYTVEYYYDGELGKTDNGVPITFEETVSVDDATIEANRRNGFKLENVENNPLTIMTDISKNVIKVYYVRDEFEYSIEYYYEDKNTDRAEADTDGNIEYKYIQDEEAKIIGKATFESIVAFDKETQDKVITGYKLETVTPESIQIGTDVADNVIRVYYTRDDYDYTVKYYYDDVLDDTATITGTGIYNSTVTYEDKIKDGYKLDTVTPEDGKLVITEKAEENLIEVRYVRDTYKYTVEYYIDGKLTKTDEGMALFGEKIPYSTEMDGYKFVKVEGEDKIVTSKDVDNIVKVYFESIPEETTTTPAPTTQVTVSPKTGDTFNLKTMVVFALILMSALVAAVIRRKRLLS